MTEQELLVFYQKQIEDIDNDKMFKDVDKGEMQKYFLGLYFYKFLSDKLHNYIKKELKDDNISYDKAWSDPKYSEDIISALKDELGYIIEPKYLWENIILKIKKEEYDNEFFSKARNSFNDSALGHESQPIFDGILSSMELSSSFIGNGEKERSRFISTLIIKIEDIKVEEGGSGNFFELAYNYYSLLAGKNKAGDFYTAPSISTLMSKIVTWDSVSNKKLKRVKSVYDSSCGSSSLMLHVKKEVEHVANFCGQDNKINAVNFSKMNLLISGISYKNIDIYHGDVLDNPSRDHLDKKFDVIVSDFQFSQAWSGEIIHGRDERFSGYPKFANKGTADYAFIQHMLSLLSDDGKMVVHCPHGVLFRDAEKEIREYLVDSKNYIETIVSLPNKLVTKKSPSTCLVVFSKCKTTDDVLFINANEEYEDGKQTNAFNLANIDKIMNAYINRVDVEKFAKVIKIKSDTEENTIANNDFNLNVPRYVDIFENEEKIYINKVLDNIETLEEEKKMLNKEIHKYLKELGVWKYGREEQ